MTNEAPQPQMPYNVSLDPAPNPPAAEPKKSRKTLWVILGTAAALIGLCCLAVIGIAVFGIGAYVTEKPAIEAVLDKYMQAMEAKDPERAYALFSERARRQVPISQFEDLLEGNNYYFFEGYQSITAQKINFQAAVNTNPDMPQGRVANVSGTISYADGIEGTFNGILEKVGDEWQLDGVFVNVPPDKIK